MKPRCKRRKASSGLGMVSFLLLAAGGAVIYFMGESFVTEEVKFTVEELLQKDAGQRLRVETVAMDGWLFSGKRSGIAVIMLVSGASVPVEFTVVGNPISGSAVSIDGEELLRLEMRRSFPDSF